MVEKMPMDAEQKFVRVIYHDEHYSLSGYYEFDERDITSHELIIELKNYLMDIFGKLENSERRIFRKHKVDARGKLNWKNFKHR